MEMKRNGDEEEWSGRGMAVEEEWCGREIERKRKRNREKEEEWR